MTVCDIIIETCKGNSAKFAFEPKDGRFHLRTVLPAGMVFPFDFGFINNTIGEDKQPLDVVVFAEFETFPGCVLACRIVGGISLMQSEKGSRKMIRNDRFIAIPEESHLFKNVRSLSDLPADYIRQLKDFFINYNAYEKKQVKISPNLTAAAAAKIIERATVT